jgi:CheY-like chemotaxis protein
MVSLDVQDAGCGFDLVPAATATLAASSTTSPRSSKFGLFTVRERTKALGGKFDMQSAPGKGTTATLMLPLAMSTEPAEGHGVPQEQATIRFSYGTATSKRHAPEEHTPTDIRVLLVDDHVMLRQGLCSVINGCPHIRVVAEAGNGLEAIEAMHRSRPDVVVMDINMPEMDGIEATKRIKNEFPHVAIIGLSVHQGTSEKQKMMDAGACAYLMKECAVDELCHAIEQAMTNPGAKVNETASETGIMT